MIVGTLTRLRPLERSDLPLVAKWRNSPAVYEFMFEREPISLAHQDRWFENLVSSNDRFCFVIETRDGKSIGLASVFGIDWRNRHAEWGFYIGEMEFRMSGHAVEAEMALLQYAFYHLNLHRVYGYAFAFNAKVLSMHRRFGFVEEGRLREHVYRGGRFEDVVIIGITRDEFERRERELQGFIIRFAEREAETWISDAEAVGDEPDG